MKSKITVCCDIFREVERVSSDVGGNTIVVDAHPEVAEMLCEEERTTIETLETKLNKRIVIQGIERFLQDEFEVVEV